MGSLACFKAETTTLSDHQAPARPLSGILTAPRHYRKGLGFETSSKTLVSKHQ